MTFESFKNSINGERPPFSSPGLEALWEDGRGNWEAAHRIVGDLEDKNAAWVHAYLHRKEGDVSNADYWYRRAAKIRPSSSLEEEWSEIVKALL